MKVLYFQKDPQQQLQYVGIRGDVGSLTKVGSMTIGYFSPPLVVLVVNLRLFHVVHMCLGGAIAVIPIFVGKF